MKDLSGIYLSTAEGWIMDVQRNPSTRDSYTVYHAGRRLAPVTQAVIHAQLRPSRTGRPRWKLLVAGRARVAEGL